MLNYLNTGIVFQEIPDEVTLSINITGCPCRCPGCHSQYLWENIGEPLTPMVLDQFVANYHREITCICFMGGDADPKYVSQLAQYLHREHPQLKVAGYSGRQQIPRTIRKRDFDYIKLGRQTGVMAAKVLKGEVSCADLPFETISEYGVYVNSAACSELSITLPEEIVAVAIETAE